MHLYVICHNDQTRKKAQSLCDTWMLEFDKAMKKSCSDSNGGTSTPLLKFIADPILVPSSPYMESGVFPILQDENKKKEWINDDYVGIVSYTILDKLKSFKQSKDDQIINWESLLRKSIESNLDFLSLFCVEFRRSVTKISFIEAAVFQHGFNFYKAWQLLLEAMGFSRDMIDNTCIENGFFCNWWMAKPDMMDKYASFANKAIQIVNDTQVIKDAFDKDAHYYLGNTSEEDRIRLFGKPFYTLRPFVFERLPTFFFYNIHARIGSINRFSISS